MQSKEFIHPKKPCLYILWLIHLSIKCRMLEFLELLKQVLTPLVRMMVVMTMMMSLGWGTRVIPIHTNPLIRCIQWFSTSNFFPFIPTISRLRLATIGSISLLFLLLTSPQLSLSMQIWKTLKDHSIDLYMLFLGPFMSFLSLYQYLIVFFVTYYLCPSLMYLL